MYPYIYIVIPSYALMALIGGIAGVCYSYFNSHKEGILFTDLLRAVLVGGVGLFLGSKILFAITQIPWLIQHFSVENLLLLIPRSGFVFYGGLFGFIFALCILYRKRPEYKEKMFQLIVPAFPLFHMFGRIGCFMSGCCYGKKLANPFVIMGIEIDRIPVQLIEAAVELLIFIALVIVKKKTKVKDLLRVYLITYAIARFCLEFLRGDVVRGLFAGLSTSQYISLAIILYYVGRKIYLSIKNKKSDKDNNGEISAPNEC